MLSSHQGQEDNENFTKILFLPPQLLGRAQTPTASAAPRGTPASGGRLSGGRTPSRTPQPPPLNTAMEAPFDTGAPGEGHHHGGDSVHLGGVGLQWSNVEDDTPVNEDSGILRGNPGAEYYDTWVTLFGFSAEDLPAVLREFLTCGDIINYDTSERGPAGNWVHVQYRTAEGAKRALLKNGVNINGNLIVGVQPPSLGARAMLQEFTREDPISSDEGPTRAPYEPILHSPHLVQLTSQSTPAKGPFTASARRSPSTRRPPIQESEMPQPLWQWLRPIGVLFGL